MGSTDGHTSERYGARLVGVSLIAFATVAAFFLHPQFETNDDAAMNMYAGGFGLTDSPSEYLMFINVAWGLILKTFYVLSSSLPWYGIAEYALLLPSLFAIGLVLCSRLEGDRTLAGMSWAAWLAVFGGYVVLTPQFTIIALYAAGAGTLLLCRAIQRGRSSNRELCFAWGLCLGGGLLRVHSAALALIVLSPMIFASFFRRGSPFKTAAFYFGVPIVLVAVGEVSHYAYYAQSSGWEQFYRFNVRKSDFTDRALEFDEKSLSQVGWSINDLAMVKNFFFVDRSLFSLDKLDTVAGAAHEVYARVPLREQWARAFQYFSADRFQFIFSAALVYAIIALRLGIGITGRIGVLVLFVMCVAVLALISLVEKVAPFRLWYPCFGLISVAALDMAKVVPQCDPERRCLFPTLASFVCALLVLLQCRLLLGVEQQQLAKQAATARDLSLLKPEGSDLYVVWGSAFPFEAGALPTRAPSAELRKMNLLALGVGCQSPYVERRLSEFGVTDLHRALFQDRHVYLIVALETQLEILKRFVQEHYSATVTERSIFEGETFRVLQLSELQPSRGGA